MYLYFMKRVLLILYHFLLQLNISLAQLSRQAATNNSYGKGLESVCILKRDI